MKKYTEMTPEELAAEKELLRKEYVAWQAKGLKLDMSRGKPSIEQLNLSMPLFDILDGKSLMKCMNGVETRNYGQLEGIVEAQHLMAEIMDCQPDEKYLPLQS